MKADEFWKDSELFAADILHHYTPTVALTPDDQEYVRDQVARTAPYLLQVSAEGYVRRQFFCQELAHFICSVLIPYFGDRPECVFTLTDQICTQAHLVRRPDVSVEQARLELMECASGALRDVELSRFLFDYWSCDEMLKEGDASAPASEVLTEFGVVVS